MAEEVINFGAGPAKLPREVLLKIQKELLNYGSTGISVMEMSHRSSTYDQIHNKTISILKKLLNVPDNYKILFLHGGGRAAFDAVAQNLIFKTGEADYLITGSWSKIAAVDAEKYGKINYIKPELKKDKLISPISEWPLSNNASYFYYCANETIEGFELPFIPDVPNNIPLVCDMTSNILTKEFDVSKYGVIFAAVQKNMGTAGFAVVIVRDDLIGFAVSSCPSIFNFSVLAKSNSLLNTPPCFPLYVCCKFLEYIELQGGIKEMERLSKIKSDILYDVIDDSNGFYVNEIHSNFRSRMNVTFRIKGGEETEKKFLKLAEEVGMIQLKGHRSVGGIRASLYNGVTVEDVAKLVGFMQSFRTENSSVPVVEMNHI